MWKFSLEQYQQMIANGTLGEDDPIELLEGWLVTKMPKNEEHIYSTEEAAELLRDLLPIGYFVRRQDPIVTSDSEPEPDVTVIKGNRQEFEKKKPTPNEVVLVIEVANSTLKRDRTAKQRIYATAAISNYWILNLQDRVLEVYTNPLPTKKHYADKTIYDETSTAPLIIEGKELAQIPVKDLLP